MAQTATNPQTGERAVLIGGEWKPYERTATNPQTGEVAYLSGGEWITEGGAANSAPSNPANSANTAPPGAQDSSRREFQRQRMASPLTAGIDLGLQAFNLSDEAAGLQTRLSNIVRRPEEQADPRAVSAMERERVQTNRRERPVSTGVAELAGGALVTTPAAAIPAVAAFGAAHPWLSAAAGGATAGAVAGAGGGETLQERFIGAGIGGVIGGILGPAVKAATGLVGRGAVSAANAIRGRGADAVSDPLERSAARVAMRAGIGPDDVRGLPAQAGDDIAFMAERSGANARQTAVGLAGSGGPAQDAAEGAILDRAAGRADRVASAASRATQMEGRRAVDSLMGLDEVRAAAKPLFNQADDEMVRVTPGLRETLRRLDAAGVNFRRADELVRATGDGRVALSTYADDIGGLPDRVRLGDLRALAMAADDEASAAYTGGRGQMGAAVANSARELRDNLRRQSQAYNQGAQLWSSAARDEDAFRLGQTVFKPGAQAERDLRRFVTSGTSQTERRMFLAGIADAIEQRTGNASATGNAASRLSTGRIRDRLQRFLGPEAADELIATLDAENLFAGFENQANRAINSATDSRLAGRERVASAATGPVRGFAADLVENPLGALRGTGARRNVANLIRQGDDETLRFVAEGLYGKADQENPLVRAILREAERRGVFVPAASTMAVPGGVAATENQLSRLTSP